MKVHLLTGKSNSCESNFHGECEVLSCSCICHSVRNPFTGETEREKQKRIADYFGIAQEEA